MTTQIRIFLSIFILAHGFIHASLSWVPAPKPGEMKTPFFPAWWHQNVDPSWPILKLGLPAAAARGIGWSLWLIVCLAAVITAAGLLLHLPSLWIISVAVLSVSSIILIAAFWHPWLPVGILIDLIILISLLLKLPSRFYQP